MPQIALIRRGFEKDTDEANLRVPAWAVARLAGGGRRCALHHRVCFCVPGATQGPRRRNPALQVEAQRAVTQCVVTFAQGDHMAHAVFIQNPESIYDDKPGQAYNFPRQYLNMVNETIGDWVIFYEGRKGAFGYVAVQKVLDVTPDPKRDNWYYAWLFPGSLLQFEQVVTRGDASGQAFERALRGEDGRPISGGANTAAVRRLTPAEFAAIVDTGLTASEGADAMLRDASEDDDASGFADAQAGLAGAPLAPDRREILTSRKYRDKAFERMVKQAYGGRCAISGLALRNGGGRPEVQAAHIRPVADDGPDIVPNGLALSGTLHWMFDRGLISVAEDHTILISHNKVPAETARRLIDPGQKLILPDNPRNRPHPEYLRYHRETVFGRLS